MYALNTLTGAYPLTAAQIIAENPQMIFPIPFELPDGHVWVAESLPPPHDLLTHQAVEMQPVDVDGVWTQAWRLEALGDDAVVERTAAARAELLQAVTARRWEVETGGITLPNGVRIATSTADQNRIATVISTASLAGVQTVEFKSASGWVTLTLDEVRGIAAAIAIHVQACFAAERAHHEAIAAAGLPALMGYDVHASWPGMAGEQP